MVVVVVAAAMPGGGGVVVVVVHSLWDIVSIHRSGSNTCNEYASGVTCDALMLFILVYYELL